MVAMTDRLTYEQQYIIINISPMITVTDETLYMKRVEEQKKLHFIIFYK